MIATRASECGASSVSGGSNVSGAASSCLRMLSAIAGTKLNTGKSKSSQSTSANCSGVINCSKESTKNWVVQSRKTLRWHTYHFSNFKCFKVYKCRLHTIFIPRKAVSQFNAFDVELKSDRNENFGLCSIGGHSGRVVVIIATDTNENA